MRSPIICIASLALGMNLERLGAVYSVTLVLIGIALILLTNPNK